MGVKKKIALILFVLLLALAVKLIWFESPFTREAALDTARWQLMRASEEMKFDLGKFGEPNEIVGKSDKDGYSFHWYFHSANNQKLSVIIAVSPLDVDFTGTPFLLDCRPGRDLETRRAGFGYLCNPRKAQ